MSQRVLINQGRRWVPLGEASRIVEVNEATLRQWADRGAIRVYRTPGGHRRFSLDDLHAVMESERPVLASQPRIRQEEVVLRRIRRRMQQDDVSHQSWYSRIDEEGRLRFRLFGRRLLSLLVRAAYERRVRPELQEEAHFLGREYGQEMANQGFLLKDTLEAFIFFRRNVLESSPDQSQRRVGALADNVLLGIAAGYERQRNSPGRPTERNR